MVGARLPEHSHCRFCGDPVPFGQDFCDDSCRAAEAEREAGEKRKEVLFYGSAVAAIAVLAVIRYLLG